MGTVERAEIILGLKPRAGRWNAPVCCSPEQARRILEAQPRQRNVVQVHVNALAEEMKAGRWSLTHEGLAFDEGGQLWDGQHRMWACFMSGIAIDIMAFFNEPRENFERNAVIVRKRTYGDQLVIGGDITDAEVAKLVAGAARFLWAYDAGKNPTQAHVLPGWNAAEMRRVIALHPELVKQAQNLRSKRRAMMPLVPMIAISTLMHEADSQKAAVFMHQFLSGEGLAAGDPALTLRERCVQRTGTNRGFTVESPYFLARAWLAFAKGQQLFKLYGSHAPHGVTGRVNGMDVFPRIESAATPGLGRTTPARAAAVRVTTLSPGHR